LPLGNYYRPITPGNYSLTFSAPGYVSQTFNNYGITAGASLELLVQLQPLAPNAAFTADAGNSCGSAVQFTDASGSASEWLWMFGDGYISTDQNPFHVYAQSGSYDVSLMVTNCAGSNTLSLPAFIDAQVVESPTLSNDVFTSCVPASFDLTATGSGDVSWYDAAVGGNLLASGSTFTTPVLSSPTTYYVENSLSGGTATVGAIDNTISGTGAYYTNQTYHYLVFDAYSSFTLAQVKVYAGAAGVRNIDLRDAGGNVLQTVSVNIPMGESYIDLNMNIPAGNGYQLGTAGGNNLYRNQGGAAFPYTLDGVVSITGNSAGAQAPTNYYYFYDWQIEQRCASPRVAVQVDVYSGPLAVQVTGSTSFCEGDAIQFNATSNYNSAELSWTLNGTIAGTGNSVLLSNATIGSNTILCTANVADACGAPATAESTPIVFTVTATPETPAVIFTAPDMLASDAANVQWLLNGVPLAGATSQTWEATQSGVYNAIAVNGSCESAASNSVSVVLSGVEETPATAINLYPNPATSQFNISGLGKERSDIRIVDEMGGVVLATACYSNHMTVDASSWSVGLYAVQISSNAGVSSMLVEVK
jgi:PKD repeat protein